MIATKPTTARIAVGRDGWEDHIVTIPLTQKSLMEWIPAQAFGYNYAYYTSDETTTEGPYCFKCIREMATTGNYFRDDDSPAIMAQLADRDDSDLYCEHCSVQLQEEYQDEAD